MSDIAATPPLHAGPRGALPLPDASHAAGHARLDDWFAGRIALARDEAQRLLEAALQSSYLNSRRAEYVAAVKALAAGPASWDAMGYRLLPDARSYN